jgi:3-phenylpropionate/cinnamic acid dioxygenase small subunit
VRAGANGIVHQFRNSESFAFVGRFEYLLETTGDNFIIREKCVRLDHETIQDQRRISIIL